MSENPIAFDAVLNVCQNQHRRIVLEMLVEEQRSLTLDKLTEAILEYNRLTPATKASEDTSTEIRVSLHHVHLPKLAAEGFVNYDREQKFVEPTEQLEQGQPTLSTILDADPSLELPMKRNSGV